MYRSQVERDIQVWNNKKFLRRPLLVRSDVDATLSRHRTWYNQFYSEHSPRMLAAASDAFATSAAAGQENGTAGGCRCGGGGGVANGHAKDAKEAGDQEANGKVHADRHESDRRDEILQPCKGIDDYGERQ